MLETNQDCSKSRYALVKNLFFKNDILTFLDSLLNYQLLVIGLSDGSVRYLQVKIVEKLDNFKLICKCSKIEKVSFSLSLIIINLFSFPSNNLDIKS